jgi:SAM-dependent methyltransferase
MTKKKKIETIIRSGAERQFLSNNSMPDGHERKTDELAGKSLIGRIQSFLKKNGAVYHFLVVFFGPVLLSRAYKRQLSSLLAVYSEKHIILNIGSGPNRQAGRDDIINVDVFPFKAVDVIADATGLPILDDTVDLIVCQAMLEHIPKPREVICESLRVLRSGGLMFSYLPFIQPEHASPDDYCRWAPAGISLMHEGFDIVQTGIGAGPTSGLLWVFEEWLALMLSLGNRRVHDVALLVIMVVLSPVKLLDLWMERLPNADKIASGFYVVARKR